MPPQFRLNFDPPASTSADGRPPPRRTPVAALFPATPRPDPKSATPLPGTVRRTRVRVTGGELQQMYGHLGATAAVCAAAATQLQFVRVEALTATAAADFGTAPQAAFAAATGRLLTLGASAELDQVNRDVATLTVDAGQSPPRWADVDAVVVRLMGAVLRLETLAGDVGRLADDVRGVVDAVAVQLVMVMYLQTPTTPPVVADAVTVLADRQASLTQTAVAARLAAGEAAVLTATVARSQSLIRSVVLNAVPARRLAGLRCGATTARPTLFARLAAALRSDPPTRNVP